MLAILFGGGLALLVSLLGTRVAINLFTRLGYGQEIREDGPTTHHTKRGTPTMGGVVVIIATLIGYLGAKVLDSIRLGDVALPSASAWLLLLAFVGMGLVGFLDDFIKVFKQRNLGLRSKAKMIGQTVIAVTFGALALSPWLEDENGRRPASEKVSFLREIDWLALPTVLAVVLVWFFLTGFSNAVNITDGLDGLAAGASVLVFGAYTLLNIFQNQNFCQSDPSPACYNVRDPLDLAIIAAAIGGALIGFLWWNASPAQIFMGDTGSLALGGALAALAVLTRTELLLVILGGLFVLVTMSVMVQVTCFKVTKRFTGVGRRVFRMTPIHHHFEMLGWEQVTIVIRFWIICGLFVAVGIGLFYADWVALGGAG
ncbi:phospho-N-acetylmuramoyl-pentapeptide-transferase [Nocardioides panacisoli]|uniref:phospho-N-acetylmuramoyl-pentapeptide- transferase n=1 Tax=Nocardioides panacisoli TaxID=627624 RepID=UPI001C63083A|nr:phospho-N-acetylmuramoyl-pentapeptide-transferase [Nocardioides panacisoli]QYJ04740.1 phospho-N-acetylmuramoyl-pentapeptide-transferase [Nocardioides panacisoli]